MNPVQANPRRPRVSPPRLNGPAQLEAWRDLLAQCALKPTRKRIHLLRVATLRLQAQVRPWLDRHESEASAAQTVRLWNKLARHLRRALGSVRAFDVHLANLAKVRATLTTSSGYEPRSYRASLRLIEALESRFQRDRKAAAKNLVELLASRGDRLQQAAAAMANEPLLQKPLVPPISAARLSAMLGSIASAFPRLDSISLHDFRKQLKSVRYLAEVAASGAAARQIGAMVKAMQVAIGEWHDWEELAAEAARIAPRKKEAKVLTDLLDTLVAESLLRALAAVQNGIAQLLPAPAAQEPSPASDAQHSIQEPKHESPRPLPPRKPVQSSSLRSTRRRIA